MTLREATAIIANNTLPADAPASEELRAAATVFATACRETNERLARCENLIFSGQRSEALRQSLIEPDLLKISTDLTLANRKQWMEFAGRNGLPAAIELNQSALRTLNAAYADEKHSDDLLKQHRLLALLRAPLKERLELVRLLARTEPNTIAWREDISDYENARLSELREELAAAQQRNSHELFQQLSAEVRDPNWVTPVPLDLLNVVVNSENRTRQTAIDARVRVLLTRLNSAIHTADIEAAYAVEDDVPALRQEFQLTDSAPELVSLAPGLDWINRESKRRKKMRNYDKALQDLRNALDHHFEWASVQQSYEIVAVYALPIPDDIQRDYARRLKRTGMIRMIGAATVIAVVIVVAIVLAMI